VASSGLCLCAGVKSQEVLPIPQRQVMHHKKPVTRTHLHPSRLFLQMLQWRLSIIRCLKSCLLDFCQHDWHSPDPTGGHVINGRRSYFDSDTLNIKPSGISISAIGLTTWPIIGPKVDIIYLEVFSTDLWVVNLTKSISCQSDKNLLLPHQTYPMPSKP